MSRRDDEQYGACMLPEAHWQENCKQRSAKCRKCGFDQREDWRRRQLLTRYGLTDGKDGRYLDIRLEEAEA